MNPTTELKRLNTTISELVDAKNALTKKKFEVEAEIRGVDRKISAINGQIGSLQKAAKGLIVSEHAILRYLERVKGVDIEAVKKEILGGADAQKCVSAMEGTFPIGNPKTHNIRIKGSTVITVLT